jgi:purine-binding chemotaxis protein CheW
MTPVTQKPNGPANTGNGQGLAADLQSGGFIPTGPNVSGLRSPISPTETLDPEELAEIWIRRAYELAEPPPAETTGDTLDLLVFLLNDERYGLEVTNVREIHPLEQITPVPRTPDFVVGVFSARGRLISVVDLRAFFGLPRLTLSDESKIIVTAAGDLEVGLLADEVVDVQPIFRDELEPALTTQIGSRADFTQGIAPGMLVVLDLENLLRDKRLIVQEEVM